MRAASALPRPRSAWACRWCSFGFERSQRYPDAPPVPQTLLINPEIEVPIRETEEGWEGCLGAGPRGVVPRARAIRYKGRDLHGGWIERGGQGLSRGWCSTNVTTLGHALSHADPRHEPLWLHRRAVPGAGCMTGRPLDAGMPGVPPAAGHHHRP